MLSTQTVIQEIVPRSLRSRSASTSFGFIVAISWFSLRNGWTLDIRRGWSPQKVKRTCAIVCGLIAPMT